LVGPPRISGSFVWNRASPRVKKGFIAVRSFRFNGVDAICLLIRLYAVCSVLFVPRREGRFEFRSFIAGTEFRARPFCRFLLHITSLAVEVCFEVLTLGLSPDESIKESQHHEEEQKPEPE
jgi:hypothetical protein